MINIHILCSNCPPPATQARSLFCHSPTDVSIKLIRRQSRQAILLASVNSCVWKTFQTQIALNEITREVRRRPLHGADRLSTLPVSSILQIIFFKPPNDHCYFLLNLLIYLLLNKLALKVKSYWNLALKVKSYWNTKYIEKNCMQSTQRCKSRYSKNAKII